MSKRRTSSSPPATPSKRQKLDVLYLNTDLQGRPLRSGLFRLSGRGEDYYIDAIYKRSFRWTSSDPPDIADPPVPDNYKLCQVPEGGVFWVDSSNKPVLQDPRVQPLPLGCERRVTADGKPFFLDHYGSKTQLERLQRPFGAAHFINPGVFQSDEKAHTAVSNLASALLRHERSTGLVRLASLNSLYTILSDDELRRTTLRLLTVMQQQTTPHMQLLFDSAERFRTHALFQDGIRLSQSLWQNLEDEEGYIFPYCPPRSSRAWRDHCALGVTGPTGKRRAGLNITLDLNGSVEVQEEVAFKQQYATQDPGMPAGKLAQQFATNDITNEEQLNAFVIAHSRPLDKIVRPTQEDFHQNRARSSHLDDLPALFTPVLETLDASYKDYQEAGQDMSAGVACIRILIRRCWDNQDLMDPIKFASRPVESFKFTPEAREVLTAAVGKLLLSPELSRLATLLPVYDLPPISDLSPNGRHAISERLFDYLVLGSLLQHPTIWLLLAKWILHRLARQIAECFYAWNQLVESRSRTTNPIPPKTASFMLHTFVECRETLDHLVVSFEHALVSNFLLHNEIALSHAPNAQNDLKKDLITELIQMDRRCGHGACDSKLDPTITYVFHEKVAVHRYVLSSANVCTREGRNYQRPGLPTFYGLYRCWSILLFYGYHPVIKELYTGLAFLVHLRDKYAPGKELVITEEAHILLDRFGQERRDAGEPLNKVLSSLGDFLSKREGTPATNADAVSLLREFIAEQRSSGSPMV
ncbi:hypothetical protein C8F01DRAFT_1109768 [Mycena amicta]|nr:hypothetical protein C8F01DRAFT_1109768 [Mycena amicta]